MQWYIIARDMHVLCAPSSEAESSLPIFNDKQTILIENNTVVSTYEFSVQQNHKDASNLQLGNYIAFKDKYGDYKLYTLKSHTGDDLIQTWTCEDIGMDLINASADKWDYSKEPHPIEWYLTNKVLVGTGWKVGVNEISNLSRSLSFDGQDDTLLTRAGDIANQFDGAELTFTIKMTGSQVTEQLVNIYKKVGNQTTQQKFIDVINLKSLNFSGDIDNLCTSLTLYGGTPESGENTEGEQPPIDIVNTHYDDGQFFSPQGDGHLYDRVSHAQWTRFRAFYDKAGKETDGYINGIYTYDTTDVDELIKRGITELKSRNHPNELYEAGLLDLDADIGDYVQIAHKNYNPPIYLKARVQQVENCYTLEGEDTGILGDYTKLQSSVDPRVQDLIDSIANRMKFNYTWIRYAEDDKGTNMTSMPTPSSKYVAIIANKQNGVPSDDPKDYAGHWTLLGKDGKDGIAGEKGADGRTAYTHFAYANDVSGTTDFSVDDPTGRAYMGVLSDFIKEDSTNPNDYVWSLVKGERGEQGIQGLQGVDGKDGIAGEKGADGKTSYTHIAYANDANGGGFSQTPDNHAYIGMYVDFEQADSTDPTKYAWSLIKGVDGKDGVAGKAGADGKTPYFHTAWADSKDGKINFSLTDSTNRGYLGNYTDFTQADSTDPAKYRWTELVGAMNLNGRNLAARKLFRPWGAASFQGDSNAVLLTDTTTESFSGLNIQRPTNYKTNTDYVLSFDFQILSGTITTIGGHMGDFKETKYIKVDGVNKGVHWEGANAFTPLVGKSFHFEIGMTTLSDYSGNTSNAFFIQPNRGSTAHPYSAEITNLRINEGNKDMGWQRPPEDIDDTIDSLQTPNLVYNAGFIGDYKVGLDGWVMEGSDKYYMTNATLYNGNHSGAINVKATVDQWWVLGSKPVTVAQGSKISFSGVSFTGGGSVPTYVGAEIGCYNSSGSHFTNIGGTAIPMTKNTWTPFKMENVTLPAGTVKISFRYTTHVQPNNQINQYISQPMMVVGEHVTPFKDNQGSGSEITQVNQGLIDANNKIAAVPHVSAQTAQPSNPKNGDQWWVLDAQGRATGFKVWNGSTWADNKIQQSMLNVVSLNAVTVTGSTINGSKFTNNFDFKGADNIQFTGVTEIANGSYKSDFKVGTTGQTGHIWLQPDGLHTYVTGANGNTAQSQTASLGFDALSLSNGSTYGTLRADDLVRIGPESWSNSDAGGTYTIAFERRWGRVWVTGEILLPTSAFMNYHTLFTIKTPGLWPKKNRWFVGMRTGNVPVAGEIEMRPNGEFVVIGVPQGGRHTFEGVSYSLGNE